MMERLKIKSEKGGLLLTLFIIIVLILILVSLYFLFGRNIVNEYFVKDKYMDQISYFSEVISQSFLKEKDDMSKNNEIKTDSELYYQVASGADINFFNRVRVVAQTASLSNIKPELLRGKDIYHVNSEDIINKLKANNKYDEQQKYYVTDAGEAFVWPGYYSESENRYWINMYKYYDGEIPGDPLENLNVSVERHEWKEATCTTPKTCIDCGITEGTVSSHTWEDATCAKPSMCSMCGLTEGTALEHTEEVVPGVEATCTETGLTDGTKCTICDEIIVPQEIIEVKEHTEEVITGKKATCQSTGLTDGKKCAVCGTLIVPQEETSLGGHIEQIVPGKKATCLSTGLTDGKKCSVCGITLASQQKIGIGGHTEQIVPGKAPTCRDTGLTDGKRCSVCGIEILAQQVINTKVHLEEVIPGKTATCTENGLSEGKKCTVCGIVTLAQQTIYTQGHIEEIIPAVVATCKKTGLTKGKKCSVCGKILVEQQVVKAKGHSYSEATCDELATCEFCGDTTGSLEEHTPNKVDGKTCTVCGKSLTTKEYRITYNLNGGTMNGEKNPTKYTEYQAITLNNPEKVGYTFTGWTGSNGRTPQLTVRISKGSTGDKNYVANYTKNANSDNTSTYDAGYTVQHWQQTVTGADVQNSTNYILVSQDTQSLTGTPNTSVTPAVKTYLGFTSPIKQTVTINADGTTLVNYYYERNSYKVNLTAGTGISNVSGAGTYRYGASVTINATVSNGYTWSKWSGTYETPTQNYTFTMPASNVSNIANASFIAIEITKPTIEIKNISSSGFDIVVTNASAYAQGTQYEYYVNNKLLATRTESTYTVTNQKAGTEISNIYVRVIDTIGTSSSERKTVTLPLAGEIPYTWDELSKIAKAISNNSSITKSSASISITVDGTSYSLKVGDIKSIKVSGQLYKTRIIGFNHDKLANASAYGGNNTYAGITFEFAEILEGSYVMNNNGTSTGGWGSSDLQTKLNSSVLSTFENSTDIKAVQKKYLKTYNSTSVSTGSYKLWPLAASEIWYNGYKSGAYGLAVGSESTHSDQKQYKYYLDNITTSHNEETTVTQKKRPSADSTGWHWTRSPFYSYNNPFCHIRSGGACGYNSSDYSGGVAPGFCL